METTSTQLPGFLVHVSYHFQPASKSFDLDVESFIILGIFDVLAAQKSFLRFSNNQPSWLLITILLAKVLSGDGTQSKIFHYNILWGLFSYSSRFCRVLPKTGSQAKPAQVWTFVVRNPLAIGLIIMAVKFSWFCTSSKIVFFIILENASVETEKTR